jgi:hypothetical protein
MISTDVRGRQQTRADSFARHSGAARWALGSALASWIVGVVAESLYWGLTLTHGHYDHFDEYGAVFGLLASAGTWLTALPAFVLALVALLRHERWRLLWLPLLTLPVVCGLIALTVALAE